MDEHGQEACEVLSSSCSVFTKLVLGDPIEESLEDEDDDDAEEGEEGEEVKGEEEGFWDCGVLKDSSRASPDSTGFISC